MKAPPAPSTRPMTPAQRRLYDLITEAGAMRLAHIADALDRAPSSVLRLAERLMKRGLIERPARGVYALSGWTGKLPPPIAGPDQTGTRWTTGRSARLRALLAKGHRLTPAKAALLAGCSQRQAACTLQHLARTGGAARVGHGVYVAAASSAPTDTPTPTSEPSPKLKPAPAPHVGRDLEAEILDAIEEARYLTLAELQAEVDAPSAHLGRAVRGLVQRGHLRRVSGAYAMLEDHPIRRR